MNHDFADLHYMLWTLGSHACPFPRYMATFGLYKLDDLLVQLQSRLHFWFVLEFNMRSFAVCILAACMLAVLTEAKSTNILKELLQTLKARQVSFVVHCLLLLKLVQIGNVWIITNFSTYFVHYTKWHRSTRILRFTVLFLSCNG